MKRSLNVTLWTILIILITLDIVVVSLVWFNSGLDFRIRLQISAAAITSTFGSAISILGAFLVSSRQFNNELKKSKIETERVQMRIQSNLLYELRENKNILNKVKKGTYTPVVGIQGLSFIFWEKEFQALALTNEVTQKIFAAYSKTKLLVTIPQDNLTVGMFDSPLNKTNEAIKAIDKFKKELGNK